MKKLSPSGFNGVLFLLAPILLTLLFGLLLPGMVITALWNALLLDTLQWAPELGLGQGTLLWLAFLISLLLWVQPEVQLHMGDLDEDELPAWMQASIQRQKEEQEEEIRSQLEAKAAKPRQAKSKEGPQEGSEHWRRWRKQYLNQGK